MKLLDYLKKSGALNITSGKDEQRRIKEFCKNLYKVLQDPNAIQNQDEEQLFQLVDRMAKFAISLMRLDERPVDQIPYEAIRGMATALGWALKNHQDVRFISFASPAIDASSRKIRDKEQYRLPATILPLLQEAAQELPSWRYEVLLADYDFRFSGQEFIQAWEENLNFLRARSGMPANRLSAIFSKSELERIRGEISATRGKEIEEEVARISSNQTLLLFFKTTPERNLHQAFLYAACGAWLEQNVPACILIDIQKKIYPCEQPFFQRARISPMAVVRFSGIT